MPQCQVDEFDVAADLEFLEQSVSVSVHRLRGEKQFFGDLADPRVSGHHLNG